MKNRRNYYRILHIQPDAPAAIIKSSYRTLMQSLKQHPDLGGDHWNASLINEAYAVLSDPERREIYDVQLRSRGHSDAVQEDTRQTHFCLFCKTPYSVQSVELGLEDCCECGSPLGEYESVAGDKKRLCERIPMNSVITYYLYWPEPRLPGLMTDLSPTGLQFAGRLPPLAHQMVKIDANNLKGVAEVKHIRYLAETSSYIVGAQFKTVQFIMRQGNFVSASV